MTHEICPSCETVAHCSQHGCIPKQPLKPCRSPYCECTPGTCGHPGCYDARGEPWPQQTTTAQDKSTKMDLKTLLDQTPRLRAWAAIGPVQHAELAQFVETVLNSRAVGVTADGYFVEPGNQVWVISSTGAPKPTTVQKTMALTNYELFGRIPVSESFLDIQQLRNYQKQND